MPTKYAIMKHNGGICRLRLASLRLNSCASIESKEQHMADSFGIPQVIDYLTQMDLQIASVNPELEMIELAFHGNHGQWRLVINLQQSSHVRKLVMVAPHISAVTR